MKIKLLTLVFVLLAAAVANGQTSIEESIQKELGVLESASTIESVLNSSNKLALISEKWPSDWLGFYYTGYARSMAISMSSEKSQKEKLLKETLKDLETAEQANAPKDEIFLLRAMLASVSLGMYPEDWQKYGSEFSINIKKAKQIRKDNPRIYYVEGLSKFYTPATYGGGKEAARIYFEKAKEYFAVEAASDVRKPYWGKLQNEEMLKKCSE